MAYYGPDWLRPYAMGMWYPADWLNGPWSKNDQMAFDRMYDFSVFGMYPFKQQFDTILNERNWNFYSKQNNIGYSDIVDPRKYNQSFGNRSTSFMLQISSNVKRLYR